jgi:hypothetical protein
MTPEPRGTAITEFLQEASQKLEQAVQIAKAAVCAGGQHREGH